MRDWRLSRSGWSFDVEGEVAWWLCEGKEGGRHGVFGAKTRCLPVESKPLDRYSLHRKLKRILSMVRLCDVVEQAH